MAKSNSAASIALELQRLSNEATQKSFQYNTQEANTARAWQTEMSNTAHQREVADLKAAGLNPVLASNNGAQSYTTSSASAQAENAANAVGNVWSSDISARATRAAAAQQAAAMRYSAAAQASAQRYAAFLAYQAKLEGYKVTREGYDVTKEGYENKKQVAEIQNNKTLFGLIGNIFKANGVNNSDFKNKFAFKAEDIRNDTSKYFLNPNKGMTLDNANWRTKNFIQSACRKTGLPVTLENQKLAFRALILQNRNAVNTWSNYVADYQKKKSNSAKAWTNRTGSGIW